ncbi:MAG TPA: XdhC family protein [Casimicrobiaceae bacterium]
MTSQELLQLAQALNERDEPYAMVTVVRVAPPTSAYVGAQAIVRRDGSLAGWIGGGCARDVVVAAAKEAIASGEPKLVRIANAGEAEPGIEQHAMACASNGTIELFIQPYSVRISLCVIGDTPAADDARFFAQRLGIRLVEAPEEARVVLLATQGQDDTGALERALASPARHVLMIASRRKADRLRDLMRMRGIDDARLARLQAPAGPDAGARTPSEIALVAMTGVLACLRGKGNVRRPKMLAALAMGEAPAPGSATGRETVATFINPVCGIAVSTREPMHVETYEGERYYFCCSGCLATFRENPAKYAAIRRASLMKV